MLLILGLILFIGLVMVHEWGHFKAARRNGVDVEEFGLFFPPRLKVLAKKNGVEYTINALPLGGFVKLKGENDADRRPGSFGAAKFSAKAKILMAGVGMNLLVAFAMLTLLALVGMPKLVDNQFTVASNERMMRHDVLAASVAKDSPAAQAGIKKGDRITAIGPTNPLTPVDSANLLPDLTKKFAGQEVTIVYVRDNVERSADMQLRTTKEVEASKKTDKPLGYSGIVPTNYTMQRYTWAAPIVAAGTMGQFTYLTFQGLGTAISSIFHGDASKATEQLSGPVGVFAVLQQGGSLYGFQFMLFVIAIISLSLAIMNALPIPALDGGRLFVLAVFRVLKKPLTKETEEMIHGIGFVALMVLIVLISVVDVRRFY